jgi:hypothetical protein
MKALPILLLSLCASGAAQDGPDQDVELPVIEPADEPVLAPGEIPRGTSEAAVALWRLVQAAARQGRMALPPIKSFDVTFDTRVREGENEGRADIETRFLFLDQGRGYIRGEFPKSGRVSMRGPRGDWLVEQGRTIDLSDRSNEESRKDHERWLAVARNLISLTRPDGVRLCSLALVTPRPMESSDAVLLFESGELSLPNAAWAKEALALRWLDLASPDFLLDAGVRARRADPVFRALLGIGPDDRVVMAFLHEDPGPEFDPRSASLVRVRRWLALEDGYLLPENLHVHRTVFDRGRGWRFEADPIADLFVVRSSVRLNLPLTADAFVPQ